MKRGWFGLGLMGHQRVDPFTPAVTHLAAPVWQELLLPGEGAQADDDEESENKGMKNDVKKQG